jgi:hypothetical protein
MAWVQDNTGRFSRRPYYQEAYLDTARKSPLRGWALAEFVLRHAIVSSGFLTFECPQPQPAPDVGDSNIDRVGAGVANRQRDL